MKHFWFKVHWYTWLRITAILHIWMASRLHFGMALVTFRCCGMLQQIKLLVLAPLAKEALVGEFCSIADNGIKASIPEEDLGNLACGFHPRSYCVPDNACTL